MYKSLFIAIAFAVQEVVKIETKTVNLFITMIKNDYSSFFDQIT